MQRRQTKLSWVLTWCVLSLIGIGCNDPVEKPAPADVPRTEPGHYSAAIQIYPSRDEFSADITVTVPREAIRQNRLEVKLNPELTLGEITAKGLIAIDDFRADVGIMQLTFGELQAERRRVSVRFIYTGKASLGRPHNSLAPKQEWTELTRQHRWYPVVEHMGSFTCEMIVTPEPGYFVGGSGDMSRVVEKWHFSREYASGDMPLVIAPDLGVRALTEYDRKVTVFHHAAALNVADNLAHESSLLLRMFQNWFGATAPTSLTVILSPDRDRQPGLYRGLAILPNVYDDARDGDRMTWQHQLAYCAAHLWWWGAAETGSENWLNESFSEYSAVAAIRQQYGLAAYDFLMGAKRKATAGLPSFDQYRRDPAAIDSLEYLLLMQDVGPVILSKLEAHLGPARYIAFCREAVTRDVVTTEQLLALVEELEGEAEAGYLRQLLAGTK